MKFKIHIIFSLLIILGSVNAFAQIGIGTKTPAPSAALEVSSIANNKGILIPRLTATQKDAIVSPAEGLLVYQTTAPIGFYYYSNTVWKLIVDQTDLDNKLASAKTYVDDKIAAATIADADATTKGKIQLTGDLGGTAAAPTVPGLALKANTTDVTTALALKANTSDLATVATSGSYNDLANKPNIPSAYVIPKASATELGGVKIGANLSIDANGVLSAAASNTITGVVPVANGGTGQTTVPGILSTLGFTSNNIAIGSDAGTPNQGGNANTIAIGGGAGRGNQGQSSIAIGYVSGDQNQGVNSIAIGGNAAQGNQGTQAVAIGFAAGQNGQGANSVAIGTFAGQSGQAANSIAINATGTSTPLNPTTTGFYVDPIINRTATSTALYYNTTTKEITSGTAASTNLASSVSGILPVANGGTGATTAAAALTSLGAAPIASPTFTGAVTAPIYASTPQALTAGSTINWNPANGLNASVTLNQNSTLNFTSNPTAGSYGTLIVTQDATGSRTITLPSIANKVLGSTSTTTITLSTAANSKDILNFYYDGTNCFWNIGQGYGSAAVVASSTANLATGVTGTLAVANGGTGATTLTGLVKGSGTSALTAAVAGTDYQAPLTLTTTGTGAATLSGTTLNIPTPNSGSSSAAVFLPTIVIGTQQWSRENLDVVTYRNGDIIPQVTDEATWNSLTTGAWCYYNNDPANARYGKLYNWYAVNDPRGLAPTGWHIPTNDEWGILIDKLNSYSGVIDKKLKEIGTIWSNNTGATNESGFTGLPGGTRAGGSFSRLGQIGMWWSSGTCAYAYLEYTLSDLRRSGSNAEFGISVRCVKD